MPVRRLLRTYALRQITALVLTASIAPAWAIEIGLPSLSLTLDKLSDIRATASAWKTWRTLEKTHDPESLKELLSLAKAGNPDARNYIGVVLDGGLYGVSRDSTAAAKWFDAARRSGHPVAAYNLGLLYLLGRGIPQSDSAAEPLLSTGAGEGRIGQAAVRLSLLARKRGDATAALKWARRANELRNRYGAYLIGRHYFEGAAVNLDYREAEKWLKLAAESGIPDAASLLVDVYYGDTGLVRNIRSAVLAEAWRLIAAGMRRDTGGAAMSRVLRLDDAEAQEAQKIARDWLGSHAMPPKVDYNRTIPNGGIL